MTIRQIHRELPLPQPPEWTGYWTFVTGAIVVMFVLFTAKKGTLSTWIGFLSWSKPATVATATDASAPQSQTPVGTALGIPGLTTLSPGASGIVQGPGGTETLNPGPSMTGNPFSWFNPSGIINGILHPTPYTGK